VKKLGLKEKMESGGEGTEKYPQKFECQTLGGVGNIRKSLGQGAGDKGRAK